MNGESRVLSPRAARRIWPWVAAAVLLLVLAAVAGGVWALHHLAGLVRGGVQVVVDGDDWADWAAWAAGMGLGDWSDWADWGRSVLNPQAWQLSLAGVLLAVVVLGVVLMVVLPVVVGLVFSAVGLALAVALLAAVVSVAAALSPLLLVALLLWLELREKPAKPFTAGSGGRGTASMPP